MIYIYLPRLFVRNKTIGFDRPGVQLTICQAYNIQQSENTYQKEVGVSSFLLVVLLLLVIPSVGNLTYMAAVIEGAHVEIGWTLDLDYGVLDAGLEIYEAGN